MLNLTAFRKSVNAYARLSRQPGGARAGARPSFLSTTDPRPWPVLRRTMYGRGPGHGRGRDRGSDPYSRVPQHEDEDEDEDDFIQQQVDRRYERRHYHQHSRRARECIRSAWHSRTHAARPGSHLDLPHFPASCAPCRIAGENEPPAYAQPRPGP